MNFPWRGKRWLAGLDEDIREHVELETAENLARGMDPAEARRAALCKFGNLTRVREDTRAVWYPAWLEQTVQDLVYAWRVLLRKPGFAAVVVGTLALGVGLNSAVFSVLNAVLLRPLSYPAADRLIWLANFNQRTGTDNFVARTDYLAWRQARSFERMTAYGNQDLALVAGSEATQERIASVAGDFWDITGAQPAAGHLFGASETNVIVLSWSLFERRFAADPRVIGKTVALNGWPFTIAGVLPPGFRSVLPQQFAAGDEMRDLDAYIPIPEPLLAMPPAGFQHWETVTRRFGPASFWVLVVGRLRDGVALETARAEMQTIYSRIQAADPGPLRLGRVLRFVSLQGKLAGSSRRPLIILLVAVAFVLLIACLNIANLLLARASTRQREIAIRAAIGAGRARVMRQLLIESLLLAISGCVAGLLAARAALAAMLRFAPPGIPRLAETTIDGRVLAFTLLLSLGAGLLFGLVPALFASKTDLVGALHGESGSASPTPRRTRLREALAAAQLACAIVLLAGAGLMFKSFLKLNARPPGFKPEQILVMRITLSGPRYSAWPAKQAYTQRLLRSLEEMPGVEAAGLDAGSLNTNVRPADGPEIFASIRGVSPGYLRAMGVPLLAGSWPAADSLFGVVVNDALARQLPGRAIAGKRLGGSFLNDNIHGVVADYKSAELDTPSSPEIYVPFERMPYNRSMRIVVRTSGDAAQMASAVRRRIAEIDPTQPVYELQTMAAALAGSIAPRVFNLFLLAAFAATALVLAALGTYAVIAYSVSVRTREIGIRLAVGARPGEIVRMVARQGMTLALAGIVTGVAAALALTRLMGSLLYEVQPHDPLTFATVSVTLGATALLACAVPARKAARVDPLSALRSQ